MSKTAQFTVRIPAPLEQVYALYTDANTIPEWFPHARAVGNATGPMNSPGSRFTIRFDGRPDAHEHVLEVVPNAMHRREFVQAQGGIGAWGKVVVRFRTVQGATEVEETVEYGFQPAFLAPLLSALMDAQARRAMGAELQAFEAFVEREVAKSSWGLQISEPGTHPSTPNRARA